MDNESESGLKFTLNCDTTVNVQRNTGNNYSTVSLVVHPVPSTSPIITYTGEWLDSEEEDNYWSSYMNGTFHSTQDYGATATLRFNGSAVYIFGSRRPDRGEYAVDLDGLTTTASGYSNNLTFNVTLFSATDLDDTEHQVALKNMFSSPAAAWVDLNYVVVTSGDGNPQYVLFAFPVQTIQ
ncbi:hypothetical protein PHLCEN_2v6168 [Hermanssonia centrifuga]|uniref:Uncharacterized protein n=1 Tax=Hermanssonia centrifuga TaxID=98765 RepID=A0A2R6P034_9APHY|nr:hypothetical protein PHLCEN_2v6168 [Hermanssonia centrifuga]